MTSAACEKILKEVDLLTPQEIDSLISRLLEQRRKRTNSGDSGKRWGDLRGSAQYPLCGQDAQEWVTRSRRESDESRAIE
jgi:hypothetical protein